MYQFSTAIVPKNDWLTLELKDEKSGTVVEIVPSAGALLNGFRLFSMNGEVNIIDGYVDENDFKEHVHEGFKSAKLSPFVCRLNEGKYTWNGVTYQVNKFMLDGAALHGLLYDAPFKIMSTHCNNNFCSVELEYTYKGEYAGYPFPYRCTVTYTLSENNTVEIITELTNLGEIDMPITDGWHPYFQLDGKVDNYILTIGSEDMLEYNSELLPTGNYIKDNRWLQGRTIGDEQLDNGFLLSKSKTACTLYNPNNNVRIEWLETKEYPFLQLYIPNHRNSIAIENLSSAPDAFNNSIGLDVLTAGTSKTYATKFCVTT
jgi:aldose 1-epimerase